MTRTPRCVMAIEQANQVRIRLGRSHISSGRLVFGLLTLNGGVGDTVLKGAELSTESVERYLAFVHSDIEEAVELKGIHFDRSEADALARAELEANAANHHKHIGVEHLILALLAEERGNAYRHRWGAESNFARNDMIATTEGHCSAPSGLGTTVGA